MENLTNVTTGKVRLSYAYLFFKNGHVETIIK